MILFLNVYLTKKKFSIFDRGFFDLEDPLNAFKFMICSLGDIKFSRIYINFELDCDFYKQNEAYKLELYIKEVFCNVPLEIRNKRLLEISEWKEFLFNKILNWNEPIFYSGNHDHVYMDCGCELIDHCLNRLKELRFEYKRVSVILSHWAEYISCRSKIIQIENKCTIQTSVYRDAMQIVTPELLREWFFDDAVGFPDTMQIRRTEDLGWISNNPFLQIIPGKELFRHIDADSHFGMRIKNLPPLRVPPGFDEGELKIAYIGSRDLDLLRSHLFEGYCCISPYFPSLAVSPDGVDFNWLFEEIPKYLIKKAICIKKYGNDNLDSFLARDAVCVSMFNDLLPLTHSSLVKLSPIAIRQGDIVEPIRLSMNSNRSRRSEHIFSLKVPIVFREVSLVVFSSRSRMPDSDLWEKLYKEKVNLNYVWISERENKSWHVQASAMNLAGLYYFILAGLYAYHFDFGSNLIMPLREILNENNCHKLVIIDENAFAYPNLADWVMQNCHISNSILIGTNQGREFPIAFCFSREWLAKILELEPNLYSPEVFSIIDVLLHTSVYHSLVPFLKIQKVRLDGETKLRIPQELVHYN